MGPIWWDGFSAHKMLKARWVEPSDTNCPMATPMFFVKRMEPADLSSTIRNWMKSWLRIATHYPAPTRWWIGSADWRSLQISIWNQVMIRSKSNLEISGKQHSWPPSALSDSMWWPLVSQLHHCVSNLYINKLHWQVREREGSLFCHGYRYALWDQDTIWPAAYKTKHREHDKWQFVYI